MATVEQLIADTNWSKDAPDYPSIKDGDHDHTWFGEDRKETLRSLVPKDAKLIVEIGTWTGAGSTQQLLYAAPSANLICIDSWKGDSIIATKDVDRILPHLKEIAMWNLWPDRRRVALWEGRSVDGIAMVEEAGLEPDVVFIDGDHSEEWVYGDVLAAHGAFDEALLIGDDYHMESVQAGLKLTQENPYKLHPFSYRQAGKLWVRI